MAYALNTAVTANDYTDAATLKCPQAIRVNVEITDAEIFAQFTQPSPGMPEDSWPWQPEIRMRRTARSLNRRTSAVRVRSAVAGAPATVTIEALTALDLV